MSFEKRELNFLEDGKSMALKLREYEKTKQKRISTKQRQELNLTIMLKIFKNLKQPNEHA